MSQAPTTLYDRIESPTVTIDVPPAELFDSTPDDPFSPMTSRCKSTLTLLGPLIATMPLAPLRLMEVSVIAALLVPPPVPSTRTPPPVFWSTYECWTVKLTIAPPVGLQNTPAKLL